ncbi:MAG: aldo/keto reductase [Acidimicrobiales bacterium]|nr:aldo/keto reductase [Acidimicrobiales bacterium]HRW38713.1 aldo/keto reductase [Aquihabitans sp.]
MSDELDLPSLVDAGARTLGFDDDTDLEVGPLAFGCWRFVGSDVARGRELIETALELDMNLIDTADIYGRGHGGRGFGEAEELLGKVLAEAPELRDQMVLATKGGIREGVPYDSSPDHLTQACDDSLRRLGVDVIDLYQVHRPDLLAHPLDVAETLDALVDSGKVRAVGVSNHTPAQVRALAEYLEVPLVSTQPEYSAAHLDHLRDGVLDQAMELGLAVLAWSPLGGGRLATGEGVRPELIAVLDELAGREGVDRATIATAFVLSHPSSPVAILGTQTPDRLREATKALDVHLDRRDAYRIIEAAEGVPHP